jgi:hypothetical protein
VHDLKNERKKSQTQRESWEGKNLNNLQLV